LHIFSRVLHTDFYTGGNRQDIDSELAHFTGSEVLSPQPFKPVPLYSISIFSRNCEPKSGMMQIVGIINQANATADKPLPALQASKIGLCTKPIMRRKCKDVRTL